VSELELLDAATNKSVLFCGEQIVDVYHYVRPLGKPTKDSIVSVEIMETEVFAGGIDAAAAHVQDLAKVTTWTAGECWRKERYVESAHFHKLFQTYIASPGAPPLPMPAFKVFDAVVVLDYGHGMAGHQFLHSIESAKYLAINVQTNSGNYGFNLATKYRKADYLCVDEPEARLATQNRDGPITDSLFILGRIADKVVVTLGKAGAIGLDSAGVVHAQTAFTDKVVDTMGAGDAFFAVTALVAQEATIPQLLRIGCAAGAVKAGIVGHRQSVTRDAINAFLAVPAAPGDDPEQHPSGSGVQPRSLGQDLASVPDRKRRVGGSGRAHRQ